MSTRSLVLTPLPFLHTFVLVAVMLALGAGSVFVLAPTLLRARVERALFCAVHAIPLMGLLLWAHGGARWALLGVRVTWTSLLILAPAAMGFFVTALAARGAGALRAVIPRRAAALPSSTPTLSRRAMVRASLSILPVSAAGAGVSGLVSGSDEARIPLVKMRFRDLHPDLEGLRILHLSDLHLGISKTVRDLESLLARASPLAPDLIVLTGDVADDLRQLRPALDVLHRYRPRLGVLASLGNHEYHQDIELTRAIYDESPIPLLVDGGITLTVGRAELHVAGADDPVIMDGARVRRVLERSISRCREGAPEGAFRLLLCHRPDGFASAARHGFHLTLAGHTHGGQIGLFGRSVFERIWPHLPLWGAYARGRSRLYTTSGFGHWFPFRLGCPTEAPLIVLTREDSQP